MSKFIFYPWEELRETGFFNEDGQREVVRVWYVIGENEQGRRIAYDNQVFHDEETAKALANAVNTWVSTGELTINPDEHSPLDPAYGSRAYVEEGTEFVNIQREWNERHD